LLEALGVRKLRNYAIVGVVAALLAACGGEDRPDVDVVDGGSVSGSASGSSSGSSSGSVSASGTGGSGAATTPASGNVYVPVSNVDAYFNFSLDIRDIQTILAPARDGNAVDWAAATALYEGGKNSLRADGTKRTLAGLAGEAPVLAIFPNGATVYANTSFLDARVRWGLTGTGRAQGLSDNARRQIVEKSLLSIVYGKALQELESAKTRVDQGNLDNATGAPHAVDEAWGIVSGTSDAGGNPRNTPGQSGSNSLLATATGRETNFKLEGKLCDPLEAAFVRLLAAAQKGDKAAFETAHTEVKGYVNAIFYLGSLRYVKSLEADTTAKAREEHLAEGWSFWQTIRASVAAASPSAAQAVEAAYTRSPDEAFPASETTKVYAALNEAAVLTALGIPTALQVKTPPTN
jgi:hypothetical protein